MSLHCFIWIHLTDLRMQKNLTSLVLVMLLLQSQWHTFEVAQRRGPRGFWGGTGLFSDLQRFRETKLRRTFHVRHCQGVPSSRIARTLKFLAKASHLLFYWSCSRKFLLYPGHCRFGVACGCSKPPVGLALSKPRHFCKICQVSSQPVIRWHGHISFPTVNCWQLLVEGGDRITLITWNWVKRCKNMQERHGSRWSFMKQALASHAGPCMCLARTSFPKAEVTMLHYSQLWSKATASGIKLALANLLQLRMQRSQANKWGNHLLLSRLKVRTHVKESHVWSKILG